MIFSALEERLQNDKSGLLLQELQNELLQIKLQMEGERKRMHTSDVFKKIEATLEAVAGAELALHLYAVKKQSS